MIKGQLPDMLKVDLHLHTADDPCDRIPHTTGELIQYAARREFNALAITLHDRQLDLAPVEGLARGLGITLIPGIERTIEGRHVLLLNFPADAVYVASFTALADLRTQHPRGLVIAPHPFFPLSNCLGALMDRHGSLFDAVEYNGCYTSLLNFNRQATRWAERRHTPIVGCSDTHRLDVFGETYSLVDAEPTPDAICDAVKHGRLRLCSRPLSSLRLVSYLTRMTMGGHHPATEQRAAAGAT